MDKKILFNILSVMLILQMNECNGDSAFKYFVSKFQKFFKMAPKLWYNYIRIFIYKYLKSNQLKAIMFNIAISKIYRYSKIFLDLKDKSIESMNMLQDGNP